MRKLILTLIFTVSIIALLSAQDYKTGVGLRGGFSSGLTLKHFVSHKSAFEGIIAMNIGNSNGFELTGLYEIHNQAFDVEHLKWYYGVGAHIGTWDNNSSSYNVGIDGILGIEYSFSEAPINIGLDWKPVFNVVGNNGLHADGGALSIRYIF
jgi:hypothetical protein